MQVVSALGLLLHINPTLMNRAEAEAVSAGSYVVVDRPDDDVTVTTFSELTPYAFSMKSWDPAATGGGSVQIMIVAHQVRTISVESVGDYPTLNIISKHLNFCRRRGVSVPAELHHLSLRCAALACPRGLPLAVLKERRVGIMPGLQQILTETSRRPGCCR